MQQKLLSCNVCLTYKNSNLNLRPYFICECVCVCVCISAIKLKQDDCDEKDDLVSPLFHCSVRNILLPPFHSKPFKD